jgi:SSS family solute:Na+ symporter
MRTSILSIGTAFIVLRFNNLMDYVQLLFSFFNAPLFATFLLGMFTTWATPQGGFCGLLLGTLASLLHHLAYSAHILPYGSDMSANFYGAMVGWAACFIVTAAVSTMTSRKLFAELTGLVYAPQPRAAGERDIFLGPWGFAAAILAVCIALNWWFW